MAKGQAQKKWKKQNRMDVDGAGNAKDMDTKDGEKPIPAVRAPQMKWKKKQQMKRGQKTHKQQQRLWQKLEKAMSINDKMEERQKVQIATNEKKVNSKRLWTNNDDQH